MGNKQQKETPSIGDVLCRKADEINRQNFMVGPVIERLKSASSQGKYFIEATSDEMGAVGCIDSSGIETDCRINLYRIQDIYSKTLNMCNTYLFCIRDTIKCA